MREEALHAEFKKELYDKRRTATEQWTRYQQEEDTFREGLRFQRCLCFLDNCIPNKKLRTT